MKHDEKIIIYQVLPRLFGNQNNTLIPHGSLEQNGCGKLNDFTDKALKQITALGANYIWYTGVIEHATQTEFSRDKIKADHSAVVKGKAGSPYAIKDYYDIAPSLAESVKDRMKEFESLVARSHSNGLKVIIDFVPNHVARNYDSNKTPRGTEKLGANDDTTKAFDKDNNFYYIPNTSFNPHFSLNDESGNQYIEYPAKATGNDQFTASPNKNDWYETVKLNYGVDYLDWGKKDFDPIPNTWINMRDILLFWAKKGIDGFRCDMVEMVPVEFWAWVIPAIKAKYPHILFIAEAYNPALYDTYLFQGGFDYLYDKVGLYDTLKAVIQGKCPASNISYCWQNLHGLESKMLYFLENHDEQRIASPYFALDPFKALPALTISACMHNNPIMIYNGQEFGEKGMDEEGFSGLDGRTTIFDYWSMDTVRRWVNRGKFNTTNLTDEEIRLYQAHKNILNIAKSEKAIANGQFFDLMYVNPHSRYFNPDKQYTFLRKYEKELLLLVVNFDASDAAVEVNIPKHTFDYLNIQNESKLIGKDLLTNKKEEVTLSTEERIKLNIPGFGSRILKFKLK